MKLISLEFLLLAISTLFFYYLFPKKTRWLILLLSSIAFFCFAGIISLIFVAFFTLSSYFAALILQSIGRTEGEFVGFGKLTHKTKRGIIFAFTAFMLVAIFLVAREMTGFYMLGISFYTLRVIAYLADVYNFRIKAEKNILRYALFVSFFPLAYLGPVALYGTIGESLFSGEGADEDGVAGGALRISAGLFKKIVIANALSFPLERIANNTDKYFGAYTLFLLVFYTVEVYCDFSGGIDICIGFSRMLGIKLPENFDRPFSSASVREFWNRWHMSLGEWFERYVFYPVCLSSPFQKASGFCRKRLGLKFGKRLPIYVATLFVWLLTGLWHGVSGHFIAWGLINGLLVIFSRNSRVEANNLKIAAQRAKIFLLIGAVRLLDVYKDFFITAKMLLTVVFCPLSYIDFFSGVSNVIESVDFFMILISLLIVFVANRYGIMEERFTKKPFSVVFCTLFFTVCTIVFGTYGQGFYLSDFIYSNFNGG